MLLTGYSIFVVLGDLPDCEASQVLQHVLAVQKVPPKLLTDSANAVSSSPPSITSLQLQQALDASRRQSKDDAQLRQVMQASMQPWSQPDDIAQALQASQDAMCVPGGVVRGAQLATSPSASRQPSLGELRHLRQSYFER